MADDDIDIKVRLQGALEAARDAKKVASGIRDISESNRAAAASAKLMGGAIRGAAATAGSGLRAVGSTARYGALGLGGLAAAGTKWGLSFNAQVESARLRFKLFTDDVDGLTRSVQKIDMNSAFNFGDLSDAAALLGNSGVKDIPEVLQGAANAAAASGRGSQALQSIVIALSQIQAKGKLSQEEINQLNEAGAPGAQRTIQKAFGLTAKEVGNLGGQGLDATKAVQALTREWTSGRMAKAASDQTRTLGGQWDLLTGNMQKLSGAATAGLAADLEHNLLPVLNRTSQEITDIFGRKGLSNEQKLRQARAVIERNLGPVWKDIRRDIDRADIPEKLGDAIGAAIPVMTSAAAGAAPAVAKGFVDAWMASGPWAQLLSLAALFGGTKAGRKGTKGAFDILTGKGAAGAAGKLAASRGQTPANPLFVWQVGTGIKGPNVIPGGGAGSKVASRLAPLAARGLAAGGPAGLALGVPFAAAIWDKGKAIDRPHQPRTLAPGTVTDGHVTNPGRLKRSYAEPVEVHSNITLKVGEYSLAKAYDRFRAGQKARR